VVSLEQEPVVIINFTEKCSRESSIKHQGKEAIVDVIAEARAASINGPS
jgi:hypothetical protein